LLSTNIEGARTGRVQVIEVQAAAEVAAEAEAESEAEAVIELLTGS